MTSADDTPSRDQIWLHRKSGGRYVIVGIAIPATNGRERDEVDVVYARQEPEVGMLFTRKLTEFVDGRFQRIS